MIFPCFDITSRLTVCVTCVWAGVDNVWEQEKLEARKMLVNRADSHTACPELVEGSGARGVGQFCAFRDSLFTIVPNTREGRIFLKTLARYLHLVPIHQENKN